MGRREPAPALTQTRGACRGAKSRPPYVTGGYRYSASTGLSIAGGGGDLSGTGVRTFVPDRLAAVRVC
jgi:hypothetical protein